MRPIFQAILVAVVTGVIMALVFHGKTNETAVQKESTFARIVRTGEIRCGYAITPSFLFVDPNTKEIHGINHDIMEAIGKILDVKIKWVEEVGWGDYIESMNAGRFDMMCASVWPSGPRSKNSTLTKATVYNALYVVVREGDHRFDDNLEKINDPAVRMAVVENDVSHSIAHESYPQVQLDLLSPSSDWVMPVMDVMTGKADVAFCDLGLFEDFNAKNPGKIMLVKGPPSRVYAEALSVPLGEHDLENALNASITTLTNSGVIKGILSHYAGNYNPPAPEFSKNVP